MAVESACIPFPSEIIMPLAGWFLIEEKGHGWEYLLLAGFYGALGNLLGSLVAYYAGMWGGRPFLLKYGRWVLITPKEIDLADRWFSKYGEITVFASRMLPVVRTFISLPAGIARMNIWRFSILSFIGAFPWSVGLAWAGYHLGANWEDISNYMRPVSIPIAIAVLALGVFFVYRRIREIRSGDPPSHGPPELEAGPP
jgi:membrane protein DedA with SNARE-associated domain